MMRWINGMWVTVGRDRIDFVEANFDRPVENGTVIGNANLGLSMGSTYGNPYIANDYDGGLGLRLNSTTNIYEVYVIDATKVPAVITLRLVMTNATDKTIKSNDVIVDLDGTPNNLPDAKDDGTVLAAAVTIDEDTIANNINVLGNDTDPDGNPLSVTVATSPNGTVTINQNGTLKFTPTNNFSGDTTITYTVSDGKGGTDTATVYVKVNPLPDAPNADDDTIDAENTGSVTINVLDNDEDPNGDALKVIEAHVSADKGTVTINDDGTLTFVAKDGFVGDVEITYIISDGKGGEDTAIATITNVSNNVNNYAPIAVLDEVNTDEDKSIFIDVLENDIDYDANGKATLTITNVTVSANYGTATIVDGKVKFVPALNFNGNAQLTYTISDGLHSTTGTATVTVDAVNDAVVAIDDTAAGKNNESITIDVLANDRESNVDGIDEVLTIVGVDSNDGTVEIVDGKVVFTPNAGFVGNAVITYTVTDGMLTSSASVDVAVFASNSAPTDLIVEGASASEHAAAGTVVATMTVVDADMPNDSFTFALSGADAGLFAIDKNGTITVLKSDSLALGCIDGGLDSSRVVNVTVTDAAGESYSETVTITVKNIIEASVVYNNPCSCKALTIHGADGNDIITTGHGNDIVMSCAGDDIIKTGYGNDTIYAGAGNDTIYAGYAGCHGIDTVEAGTGNDKIILDSTSIKLNGNEGFDTVVFGAIRTLDMTSNICYTRIPEITNIEAIDMRDTTVYSHCGTSYGTADKLILDANAVDKMTTNDVLYVNGNTNDKVVLEGGKYVTSTTNSGYCCSSSCTTKTFDSDWDKGTTSTVDGINYTSYIANNETVWVQAGVTVAFA